MGKSDMGSPGPAQLLNSGLCGLSLVAGYYRIAGDPTQLRHQLALTGRRAQAEDVVRGANVLKLKSRILRGVTAKRLGAIPFPALLSLKDGGFAVLGAGSTKGMARLVDPIARTAQELSLEDIAALSSGELILITRRFGGAGADPTTFGFRWFWPSNFYVTGARSPMCSSRRCSCNCSLWRRLSFSSWSSTRCWFTKGSRR